MRKIQIIILLACILPALLLVAPAGAQEPFPGEDLWTNTEVVIDAEEGPAEAGMTPGTDGYKVFNPGAIKILTSHPTGDDPQASQNILRKGTTDVWGIWGGPFQNWKFTGSHTSTSSIFEKKIWADGALKYLSQGGWQSSCAKHTAGRRAHCNTTFSGWYSRVYAHTYHVFRAPGYLPGDFATADSY